MKTHLLASLLLVSAAAPAALVSGSILQVADLKTFFHGAPAAAPKAPPPAVTAVVTTVAGVTVDKQVENFFRTFAAALKARDGAPMRPLLAEKYTIADLPEGANPADFFVMGVEQAPGPEAITIQSIETKDRLRTVKAEIRYAAKAVVKIFRFDHEGRLLASDLFKLKREVHGT